MSELFMSIIETAPDDGSNEWRHIIPNKFVREAYCQHGPTFENYELAPTLEKFEAKRR